MAACSSVHPSRVKWENTSEESVEKLPELWTEQDKYIDYLESRIKGLTTDAHRRENLLIMRLTAKETELNEMSNQISELKASQAPSSASLRTALLDPAVNCIISRLQKELEASKTKMAETQEELNAWKFTPDSGTGKRLMSKCRQLLQENEDIGKMIASGRLSKLEGELSMTKNLASEMKKNQLEMDEFVQELDEDVEGMQSTIYYLQTQLKEAKEKLCDYEKNTELNNTSSVAVNSEIKRSSETAEESLDNVDKPKRGRRSLIKTESPRRSTRGQKRENENDKQLDVETTPGRPKRRKIPQSCNGDKEENETEDKQEVKATETFITE